MRLIVGLGNPGQEYANTRHNVGFMVVDRIAAMRGIVLHKENEFKAETADITIDGEKVKLVKPQTFMNNSGEAVSKIKHYYKVDNENIWVIHDDIDLDFAKVRAALGGSSAGHKGVQSIINHIDTDQFWRIRVGVGRDEQIPTDAWVLANFSANDHARVDFLIDSTADFVIESLGNGIMAESRNFQKY